MFSFKNNNAFTIIELLIVTALMVLLVAFTAPFELGFYSRQILEEETSMLANNLKTAQSRAQTGKNDNPWGIRFFEDHYVLFAGESYNERDQDFDKRFNLNRRIETEGIVEIVFEKYSGEPRVIVE